MPSNSGMTHIFWLSKLDERIGLDISILFPFFLSPHFRLTLHCKNIIGFFAKNTSVLFAVQRNTLLKQKHILLKKKKKKVHHEIVSFSSYGNFLHHTLNSFIEKNVFPNANLQLHSKYTNGNVKALDNTPPK